MEKLFRNFFRYGVILIVLVAAVKGIMTCSQYQDSVYPAESSPTD